jgi:hypothetical protein
MLENVSKYTWEENGVCGDRVQIITVSEIYSVRILYLEAKSLGRRIL